MNLKFLHIILIKLQINKQSLNHLRKNGFLQIDISDTLLKSLLILRQEIF